MLSLCMYFIDIRYTDGGLGLCSKLKGQEDLNKCDNLLSDRKERLRNERIWFSVYCLDCDNEEWNSNSKWMFRDFEMQLMGVNRRDDSRLSATSGTALDAFQFRLVKNLLPRNES